MKPFTFNTSNKPAKPSLLNTGNQCVLKHSLFAPWFLLVSRHDRNSRSIHPIPFSSTRRLRWVIPRSNTRYITVARFPRLPFYCYTAFCENLTTPRASERISKKVHLTTGWRMWELLRYHTDLHNRRWRLTECSTNKIPEMTTHGQMQEKHETVQNSDIIKMFTLQ